MLHDINLYMINFRESALAMSQSLGLQYILCIPKVLILVHVLLFRFNKHKGQRVKYMYYHVNT